MANFQHDGLNLAFTDQGEDKAGAILMIHGFASNAQVNWVGPGWFKTFLEAGYRCIAIDNRGHGQSDKPHDADAYYPEKMADDAAALLDHLSIKHAHVFGYSMGARITAFMAARHPARVQSMILGGLGMPMVTGVGDWDPIADALLAPSLDMVEHPRGRMFRAFADDTGSDRFALAACIKSSRTLVTEDQLAAMSMPALIGVGTKDDIGGDPHGLAKLMPNAQVFEIERRDHMQAVGDRTFKAAVLDFLAEQD